jgi:hypothetical protein
LFLIDLFRVSSANTSARTRRATQVMARCLSCWSPCRSANVIWRRTTIHRAGVAQSVWCLTTGWTTGRSGFDPRQGQRIFPLSSVSRPALGPTQPPVQWVTGVLSPGVKRGRGVMLTTHPHLVPRS